MRANAICEQMHQSIGNSLRILRSWQPPQPRTEEEMVDAALANAMYATRASYHGSLKTSPGALAFHRDMVMNIPLVSDLTMIQQNRQALIDQRLIHSNLKRFAYDYQPNQEVLLLAHNLNKLQARATRPFRILAVLNTNGTITIQKTQLSVQCVSIRSIKPFHG
jgi:hypothetical protein